jgi:AraC-like DNA-binding protein
MTSVLTHIFLFAAVQGLLLVVLLFTRGENKTANAVLGALVGALSLDLLQAAYTLNHVYREHPHLMGITYAFPFLYGPLFYLYARLLTSEQKILKPQNLLHFSPFFLIVVSTFHVYFMSGAEKIDFIDLMNTARPLKYTIIDHLRPIHGFIYTVLVIRVIARHNRRIRETYSNIDRINLLWLRSLTVAVAVIWSIVVGSVLASSFFDIHFSGFDFAIYFSISILIYTIGYIGLLQPAVIGQESGKKLREAGTTSRAGTDGGTPRYSKSGLADETGEEILHSVTRVMRERKPYMDPDLTLGKLAGMLAVSPHNLSEVINTRIGQNFYDFVNVYRVEEVKQRLQDPESQRFSLLSIAFDSGFKSKTSFNTIFKKQTTMTPSQYRKHLPKTPTTPIAPSTGETG